MSDPFLIRPRPVDDESLRDWFINLTFSNYYRSPARLIKKLAKERLGYPLRLSQLDYVESAEIRRFLGELALYDGDLQAHPLYAYRDMFTTDLDDSESWKHFVDLSVFVCPFCLEEKLYIRKSWHLRFAALCTKHRTWLSSSCLHCGEKWNQKDIFQGRCSNCETAYKENLDRLWVTDDKLMNTQSFLKTFVERETERETDLFATISPRKLFLFLYGLSEVIKTMPGDWNYHYQLQDINAESLSTYNNRIETLVHYTTTLKVIEDWPNNFFDFLSSARLKHGLHTQRGLTHEFETFYTTWLMERWPREEFGFLHDAFEEYVGRDIIPYGQLKKSRLVQEFDEFEQNSDFISLSKAVESTGISFMALMQHIQTGKLKVYRARFEPMEYLRKSDLKHLLD